MHTVLAFGAIRHRAGLGRSRESQIQTGKLRWVAPLLSNALTLLPARGHFTRSRIQLDCHCRRVLGTALPHKRRIKGLPGILRYFVQVSRVKHHIVCADATPRVPAPWSSGAGVSLFARGSRRFPHLLVLHLDGDLGLGLAESDGLDDVARLKGGRPLCMCMCVYVCVDVLVSVCDDDLDTRIP